MQRSLSHLFFIVLPFLANAQPGTLDASFGVGGVMQIDLMPDSDAAQDALPMNDGRLYVSGYLDDATERGFILRLLIDGTPDPTFGTVQLPAGAEGRAFRMAYAPDSSIYVCGYADTLGYQTVTAWRILSSGLLDPSFGINGRSSLQIGFSDARARDLVVQSDGKVVLAGYESSGFGRDGVFVRLLPSGVPDSTFSGDGILVLSSYTDLDQIDAVTLLNDGSIIGGGYTELNNYDRALLVKLTPAGTLDNTFDGDGLLTPTFNTNDSRIYGVEGAGQQVVAAGALMDGSTSADLFLIRRNANGTADTGFGNFGVAEIDVFDDDWLDELELLPDGRLAITGYTGSTAPGGDIDFLLACYTADGDPDLGFGTNGIVITETSPYYEGGYGICTMPDGKLVVAGFGGALGNSSMVVLRYANDLTTAIAIDPLEDGSWSLFPVPNDGRFQVVLSPPGRAEIHVRDLSGRIVYQEVRPVSGIATLDLDLSPGTYSVELNGSARRMMVVR